MWNKTELQLTFGVNRPNVAEESHSHFQYVSFLKLGVATLLHKIIKANVNRMKTNVTLILLYHHFCLYRMKCNYLHLCR